MATCAREECVEEELAQYTSEDLHMLTRILEKDKPVQDIIDSFNYWVNRQLQEQLNASPIVYKVNENTMHSLTFKMGLIVRPTHNYDGKNAPLFAHEALKSKLSMVSQVLVSPVITVIDGTSTGTKTTTGTIEAGELQPFFEIPVMKGSILDRAHGLTGEELLKRGENLRDPGGYFIYRGTRSSIPSIEKLRINQVHVMASCKKFAYRHARQTVSVPTGTAVMKICYMSKKGNCGFTTSILKEPTSSEFSASKDEFIVKEFRYVGIFHMLRLLAHVSNQVGSAFKTNPVGYGYDLIMFMTPLKHRAQMRVAINPSIIELHSKTTTSVVSSLIGWLNMMDKPSLKKQRSNFHVVKEYIVNHVYYSSKTMLEKAHSICYMTWRLLSNVCGIPGHNFTSMNDWGNKRLDVSAVSFSQIFRSAYHSIVQSVEKMFDKGTTTQDSTAITTILGKRQTITDNLMAPFKGNPGKKNNARKAFELAEMVKFHNMVDLYCALTKINVKVDRGTKDRAVRAVQETQGSKVCIVDTPDDDGCGIIKHSSIGARVTSGFEDQLGLVDALRGTGLVHAERTEEYSCPIQVNFNSIYGWCDGLPTYLQLVVLRRGSPAQCTSITVEDDRIVLSPSLPLNISYKACVDTINMHWDRYLVGEGLPVFIEGEQTGLRVKREFATDYLRWSRSLHVIPKDTCISLSKLDTLEIYSDMGRMVRPVYVVDKFSGVHQTLIDRYSARSLSIQELEQYGFIDYIDAYEENSNHVITPHSIRQMSRLDEEGQEFDSEVEKLEDKVHLTAAENDRLAHFRKILDNRDRQTIRYVGIHGITLFGVSIGTSPYVNHNPFSRNTFASKTRKQTLTSPFIYTEHRDSKHTLSSTVPLVDNPDLSSIYGLGTFTQGNPAVVGIYTDEFNQEDSIVVSSSYAADKMYLTTYTYEIEIDSMNPVTSDELKHPRMIPGMDYGNKERFRFICENGLPMIGAELDEGDVIISVCSKPRVVSDKTQRSEYNTSNSVLVRKEEKGVVVSIVSRPVIGIKSGYKASTVTRYSVLLERKRVLKNGDKMSTAHGQKATIYVVPYTDMPFDEHGTVVDILMNSHALPTRLTGSLELEMILGKAGALRGELFKGTSFEAPPKEEAEKILHEHGYIKSGYGILKAGTTGATFRTSIYVGIIQMQELVHKAQDKRQARGATGRFDMISRQPKKGRPEGAARTGEQERDAIIAHAAIQFALERFKTLSDNYVEYVCTKCYRKVFDPTTGTCPYCNERESVVYVNTTFAYNVIRSFLMAVGIELHSEVRSLVDIVSDLQKKDLDAISQSDEADEDEGELTEEEEEIEDADYVDEEHY